MCVDDSVAEILTAPRTWRSWILMDIAYILSIRHPVGLCVPVWSFVCVYESHTRECAWNLMCGACFYVHECLARYVSTCFCCRCAFESDTTYIHVCMYMYTYMHTYKYARIHTYIYIYVYIYLYVYIHIYIYIHIYVFMCVYIYTCFSLK